MTSSRQPRLWSGVGCVAPNSLLLFSISFPIFPGPKETLQKPHPDTHPIFIVNFYF